MRCNHYVFRGFAFFMYCNAKMCLMMVVLQTGANWALFARTFSAWVLTLLITAVMAAALFAQGGLHVRQHHIQVCSQGQQGSPRL